MTEVPIMPIQVSNKFKKIAVLIGVVIAIAVVGFCRSTTTTHKQVTASKPQTQIVIAKMADNVTHLYYNGIIEPLTKKYVTSHVDGTVQKVYVSYGAWVKSGQKLVLIHSNKAQEDYAKQLADYVRAKDQYLRSTSSFEATAALYKAGIISQEEYMTQKSQNEGNKLQYLVAETAIKNMVAVTENQNIENLSLGNIDALQKVFEKKYIAFTEYAPISGILLTPDKNSGDPSGGGDSKEIIEGSDVKEHQILFTIGDMSGIAINIDVGETQIDSLREDQSVTISSWALPGMLFQGKITRMARQASANNMGGAVNFGVEVVAPNITEVERKLIRIGMTAKIDVAIQNPPAIKLPLQAVTQENGMNYVTLVDTKDNKQRKVAVQVGDSDVTQIAILSGIKPGDAVLVKS